MINKIWDLLHQNISFKDERLIGAYEMLLNTWLYQENLHDVKYL